ncbi:hypothetical protein ACGFIF_17475 [Kribbella sp. NPDC049174]|uniref:hypothetical protein n=1 Tax=Kribbella sp. NPDC049174 TaxID=3364112 RepID=UPI00371E4B0D
MSTLSTGFVDGRLYRTCMFVYQLLVIEACLVVALLPTALSVVLLEPDPRNALLFAVAVIPAGPALVAGLYAVRRMEQSPVRDFVRGYRLSWLDVVKLWAPAAVVISVLSADWLVIVALVALWLVNVLVITARFSFRVRDTARLSAYYLGAQWRCTLNLILLGAGFVFLVTLTSDWVAVFLLSPVLCLLARITRPLVADVERRFV